MGAEAYAHGATGKGNDQCRFQLAAEALEPGIRVIAPWRIEVFRDLFPGRSEWDPHARPARLPTARLLTALSPLASLAGARALSAFDPDLVVAEWWNAAITLPVVAALVEARARGRAGVVMAHNARSHDGGRLDTAAWSLLARVADAVVVGVGVSGFDDFRPAIF